MRDVMRWRCPVDDCEWTHDEPTAQIEPLSLTLHGGEDISDAINREVRRRTLAREAIMREHAETHDVVEYVRTIAQLRHRLACAGDPAENERLGVAMAVFGTTDA